MIWKWKRDGRKINSLDGGNGSMFNTIYNFIACFIIKPNKPEMEKKTARVRVLISRGWHFLLSWMGKCEASFGGFPGSQSKGMPIKWLGLFSQLQITSQRYLVGGFNPFEKY